MIYRHDLKQRSRELFLEKYWLFVLAFLIYTTISGFNISFDLKLEDITFFSPKIILIAIVGIAVFVITGPMEGGMINFILNQNRYFNARISDLFSGFFRFKDFFLTYLLTNIFIFLWSLLLIIPGIIKALAYSQAMYIMYDNPSLSPMEAIKESKKIMYGHKMELFKLHLSFLGWILLSVITLNILNIFYVGPYYKTAIALYYEEIKVNM